MEIKSIGVVSAGKIQGGVGVLLGLLIGGIFSLLALAGLAGGKQGIEGMILGAGAIVIFPIFYGVGAFIGGMITAVIYNIVAAVFGGLEIEIKREPGRSEE